MSTKLGINNECHMVASIPEDIHVLIYGLSNQNVLNFLTLKSVRVKKKKNNNNDNNNKTYLSVY